MNLILLGCPGAGKGTQAEILAKKRGLKHLSTGAIFREDMEAKTELGQKAGRYVSSGKLVPDELVVEIVANRVTGEGAGVILDGVPRTIRQAEELDKLLHARKQTLTKVLFFDLSEKDAVARMVSRGRADDDEETVKKRLMVYRDQTEPLIAYYKAQGILVRIEAGSSIEDVAAKVDEALKESVES